ncbi:MAG: ribose-phosphate diphosphokinase [Phyllobacteriaceae bacterium]|nr:ribose-phosphate diphosphokinase [Phyllobacteriaceae bacterium]
MTAAVFTLARDRPQAEALAAALGVPTFALDLHRFPDGEIALTLGGAAEVALLHLPLDRPNDKLVALALAAEALRRTGTRRIVLVAPYLCYMRQDVAFTPGQAVSQKAIGRLIAGLVDRVVTVDAHLHRTHEIGLVFPGIAAENLAAGPAVAAALAADRLDPATVVVGPDVESEPLVAALAARLGLAHAVGRKTRRGDRSVEIAFADPAVLAGRPALVIDDVVSSGGTLVTVAEALRAAGATRVDAVVTHALYPPETAARFAAAGIGRIRSTTSVPHPSNAVSLVPLLAEALRAEIGEEATS